MVVPALALATVAMTVVAVALAATGTPGDAFDRALREVILVATPGAVGLYATRLPGSARFGQLLMGAGLLWSLSALAESSNAVAYSTGRVAAWLSVPVLLYVVLAFPLGRLPNRVDRRLFGGGIAATVVLVLLSALFIEAYPTPALWSSCTTGCPPNAFFVLAAEPAVMHTVVAPVRELVAIVVMAGVTLSLVGRWRAGGRLRRRQLAPVAVACIAAWMTFTAFVALRRAQPEASAVETLGIAWALWFPGIAVAFYAGLVRGRAVVERALERLGVALREPLEAGQLERELAVSLDDPSLLLLLPGAAPGRWHDLRGHAVARPGQASPRRAETTITDDGEAVAMLVHDRSLCDDDEILESVSALVCAALRHERMQARLECSLAQLAESRERIAAAADLERSRIERNLHDGAQQRLISIRIQLSLAEQLLRTDPEAGHAAVAALGCQAERALEELRELGHGLYPPVLSDRGLADALHSMAMEAGLPVRLFTYGIQRHPVNIEGALYFMTAEAIQNAVKHGRGATGVWVTLCQVRDEVTVEIRDDGQGFVPGRSGNGGMRNMRDRIEAIGGLLLVDSAPGRGTRVLARVCTGARTHETPVGAALDLES